MIYFGNLGITNLAGSTPATEFGQGTGLIVLNEVHCAGSETRLMDCITGNTCRNNQHAGVHCQAMGGNVHS